MCWAINWPDSVVARTRVSSKDPGYISINVLEHAALFVGYAMVLAAWQRDPRGIPHPSFLLRTDNTSAEAWLRRMSVAKNRYSRAIGKLFLKLLWEFPLCNMTGLYIKGDDNVFADFLSRLKKANSLTATAFPLALQTQYPRAAKYERFHLTSELSTLLWSALSGRSPNLIDPLPKMGSFHPMSPGTSSGASNKA